MRAHSGLLAALALLFVLTGCPEEGPLCAAGEVHDSVSGDCIPIDFDAGPMDAGNVDAGPDAGPDGGGDAGPCGVCPPGLHCDAVSGDCLSCTMDEHCEATEYCDTAADTCMTGCRDDDGCTDPLAPICQAHACVPGCASDADCTRFGADGSLCDERTGSCGACNVDDDCAGSATCDLVVLQCTGPAEATLTQCQLCTNDRQCTAGHHCVPMFLDGTSRGDHGYCLKIAPCPSRHFSQPISGRDSLNGASGQTYCGVNEALTTCEAVTALVATSETPCTDDGGCPEGGICRDVGTRTDRICTYPCGGSGECPLQAFDPNKAVCGDPEAAGTDYCGGGIP